MTTKDEALKLALGVLRDACILVENHTREGYDGEFDAAITAIRAALASKSEALYEQPAQQEPVAVYVGETWCGSVVSLYEDLPLETPLYTSPQPRGEATLSQSRSDVKPWVGLTQEQRASIAEANNMLVDDDLFDAIEAKLREKNT